MIGAHRLPSLLRLDCRCYRPGANKTNLCDLDTGKCNCLPNVYGDYCDSCEVVLNPTSIFIPAYCLFIGPGLMEGFLKLGQIFAVLHQ